MIQLAWRFLMFQKNSALAQWFRARTENARGTRSRGDLLHATNVTSASASESLLSIVTASGLF
jgi:hypothetical protein